ncbi:fibronectin type III domain-containing protein [Cryobacterium glaciale]|uniref:Fibronectin type III domain-containing protein n=1 Tax=Cryobacterium glaciale TaxID=1259145 RepID=A0A4R8V5Z8_9MICO|nr:fibronectin type III domain-containing protein [Cryobacterium glaciale]TFB77325.1 fibronectin type III domain-containing protein [Cryobacterium glaciale]
MRQTSIFSADAPSRRRDRSASVSSGARHGASVPLWKRVRAPAFVAVVAVIGSLIVTVPVAPAAAVTESVTQTFGYSTSVQTFTVPDGVTELDVKLTGGQGGRGGTDSAGAGAEGGYRGMVTGLISVTPGQVLQIGVGQGGTMGAGGNTSAVTPAGTNPITGYAGGVGGIAGFQGSSGNGGGAGAATVVTYGAVTLVAGGAGGGGGSGQFAPTLGRQAEAAPTARTDTTSTNGQPGLNTESICTAGIRCDGGASGGGGGGVSGGMRGNVEFGAGSSTEYFGYGGFPGTSSTASLSGVTATYEFFSGNSANGALTITYSTGIPGVPTAVAGVAGKAAVDLAWAAGSAGGAVVADYVVEYARVSAPSTWSTFADGVSTALSTTVSGLTNGVAYIFRVSAVNEYGAGSVSVVSAAVTPSDVPGAPVLTGMVSGDSALSVAFTAAASDSPVTAYEVSVDSGVWAPVSGVVSPVLVAGLSNDTGYSVRLRAVNAIGAGAASNAVSGTPSTVPGAPTISAVQATSGTAVSVSFTAGFSSGPVTDYEYRVDSGSWVSAGMTASPLLVSGLSAGTLYSISVRAVNGVGGGAVSLPASVTTLSAPAAPTISAVVRGDRSATVSYVAGAEGGSAITGVEYQTGSGGTWTNAGTISSPLLLSGLTNGTEYAVTVRLVNAIGTSAGSAAMMVTPATIAAAPTIVGNTVAGSDQRLSASFTAPSDDGGALITGYEYSTDAGATWRARSDGGSTGSPLQISTLSSDASAALTNGQTYGVELRAVTAVGVGAASALAEGMARTVPSAPSLVSVTGSNAAVQVAFLMASNGGSAISRFEYQLDGGAWANTGSLSSSFTIGSLSNGTNYSVAVRGINAMGDGAASAALTAVPATVASAPTLGTITRSDRTLSIGFTAGNAGGSALTGFEYSTDGGLSWRARTSGSTGSPLVITVLSSDGATRLVNGVAYPVQLRAVNGVGAGSGSVVRSVPPMTPPGVAVVTASAGNGSATFGFTVADDGGSPVTMVQYRLDGGAWIDPATLASPFLVNGLTNGQAYSVQLRTSNNAGFGSASTAVVVTPRTAPDAPTGMTAVVGAGSATVSWVAPQFDGGSAVTGYAVSVWAGSESTTPVSTVVTTDLTATLTGLTNGTTVFVSVAAVNGAGAGAASAPRVSVTPLAKPFAPTISTITAQNTFLRVAFTAGSAGTRAITGYDYQLDGGAWVPVTATTSPIVISGLVNGTTYAVALRAKSAAGIGAASAAVNGTPASVPTTPDSATIVAVPTTNGAVISWPATPANGSPVTSYSVIAWSAASQGVQGSKCSTTGALTCTLTGFSGTQYITVEAANAVGTSTRSSPRVAVTPGAPGVLTSVSGTAGNTNAVLTWAAGTAGSSAISDYKIRYAVAGSNAWNDFSDGVSTGTTTTVTGLTNGTAYDFGISAVNGSGTGPWSPLLLTPIAPGTVPTLGAPVATADGFTVTLTNYDAAVTYALSATNGASFTRSGANITVSALAAGASAALTVNATRTGFTPTSAATSGTALLAGLTPTFGTPVRTADGFTVDITNWDPNYTFVSVVASQGMTSRTDSTITVIGLTAGTSQALTVTTTRGGYASGTGSVTGQALSAGVVPMLSGAVAAADGFTLSITNLSGLYTYGASSTAGLVSLSGGTLSVTGLADGATAVVTVVATRTGFTSTSATASGAALLAGTPPTVSSIRSVRSGFSFDIANFNESVDYTVDSSVGSASRTGSTVTITGLADGQSASVIVEAIRTGYTTTQFVAIGSALLAGVAPVLSDAVSTAGGFTVTITNFSADYAYSVTSASGSVERVDGVITVTGLDVGGQALVMVQADRFGYTSTVAGLVGSALRTGTAAEFSAVTRTADGFTVTIANYDARRGYTLAASAGTAVQSGARITVTGLAAGGTSDVTVTVLRAGDLRAHSTVSGTASLAVVVPTPVVVPGSSVRVPTTNATTRAAVAAAAAAAAAAAEQLAADAAAASAAELAETSETRVPPSVGSGVGAVTMDGVAIEYDVTQDGSTRIFAGVNDTTVSVTPAGSTLPEDATVDLTVPVLGEVTVGVTGFREGSVVEAWVFSTPTFLGEGVVAAGNTMSGDFTLPEQIRAGQHTLVVTGLSATGEEASYSIKLTVTDDSVVEAAPPADTAVDAPAGLDSTWWIILAGLIVALVGGLVWFLIARRRREDDERTA